jgi:predicted outer membrane protein
MKNSKLILGFIFAGMFIFLSCNNDGNNGNDNRNTDNDTSYKNNIGETKEEDFVTDVLDMNERHMIWLKAGINQGTDNEIKSLAQKMLSDQQTLASELRDYAQTYTIDISPSNKYDSVDIRDTRGVKWDQEWADEVGDNYDRLVNRFERAQRRIKNDAALSSIIDKTLPVLQSHRNASRSLEERLD